MEPTNYGFDSLLLFEGIGGQHIHLIIESKLQVKPTKAAIVNYKSVLGKRKNVSSKYGCAKGALVLFLYTSDECLLESDREKIKSTWKGKDAQRVIVWDAFVDEDKLKSFSCHSSIEACPLLEGCVNAIVEAGAVCFIEGGLRKVMLLMSFL